MEYLKYLAIGIGILAGWSILLWISGYWSRNSFLGKVFSGFVLIISALVLLIAFFLRPNLGTINVSVEKGIIRKINKIELIADLKLAKYSQKDDLIIIDDEKGRHYQARLLKSGGHINDKINFKDHD